MINEKVLMKYISFVKNYIHDRLVGNFSQDKLLEICDGMNEVLLDWTGNTYVGRRKDANVQNTYQAFFLVIHEFLVFCNNYSEYLDPMESTLAEMMMYRGIVYRYLGIADSRNYRKKERVEPEYNGIFVSWSKSEENSYILSKLYGPVTWMKAEIKEPYFGIDIQGFELWCEKWLDESPFITRGEEKEVVFPTIAECIIEKRYSK